MIKRTKRWNYKSLVCSQAKNEIIFVGHIIQRQNTILSTFCYIIACKNDTWGPGCHLHCHCKSGSCNNVNGTCKSGCKQGYTGEACQELLPLQQSTCMCQSFM